MARDYKHRVQSASYASSRRRPQKKGVAPWRWLVVIGLVAAFVVFLNMIRKMVPELTAAKPESATPPAAEIVKRELPVQAPTPAKSDSKDTRPEDAKAEAPPPPAEPEEPRYEFYTILPQAEVVVPDYEIKTRVREQLVGKTKVAKYVMQAGSFREAAEAERHKAKLALLGIESRVEKAKVGETIWHRVKIGPYDNPASVSTIKELLQKNGIGVIVTENGQ